VHPRRPTIRDRFPSLPSAQPAKVVCFGKPLDIIPLPPVEQIPPDDSELRRLRAELRTNAPKEDDEDPLDKYLREKYGNRGQDETDDNAM
jgi:hypothetical protein